MKKSIKSIVLGGVIFLALPLMLISCEDILGEWSRPTPTPEEILTNLSAALEEGAVVTITYTIDGVTYTSTFKKVGDEYVEQSTTSAARALTRAGETGAHAKLQYMPSTAVFNVQVFKDGKTVLNAEINSKDGTCTPTFNKGAELKGMQVNDQKASLTNANDKAVSINKGVDNLGSIGCKAGEKWEDLCDKQSRNGHVIIQKDDAGGVLYSNGGVTGQLYKDADCTNSVLSGDEITKGVYVNVETIPYLAASWNGTSVAYDISPSTSQFTLVSPSDSKVTWSGGTYVVKDNVTIGGDLTLDGDVNLILCDGKTLTVNGEIIGNDQYSLTIYGQSQGDTAGKLEVNADLHSFSYLTIHGGNITVNDGWSGIFGAPLTVYGGKLSITSDYYAIETGRWSMTVYGGEVNAISKKDIAICLGDGDGTLTVYGGKVTAEGGEDEGTQYPAIKGKFTAGEGTSIRYKVSEDGTAWGDNCEMPTTPMEAGDDRYFEAWRPAPPASTSRR